MQTLEQAIEVVNRMSPSQGNEAKIDIRVGNYITDNPVQLPPYTVVQGEGTRLGSLITWRHRVVDRSIGIASMVVA